MKGLLAYLITWVLFGITHPFHISLTEIRQNSQSRKLEIAQKIFWDDLEIGLKKFHGIEIDFLNPKDPNLLQEQTQTYLLAQNEIWVDGKKTSLKLLGFEIEGDAAWFYLESDPVSWKNKIEIRNSVLISEFPDQQNIVHLYSKEKKMINLLLKKGNERGILID